jgi:hypothetical protein
MTTTSKNPYLIRDLVYGVSGSGKTTWWLQMAKAVFAATGKKTRWYLGDGGGATIYMSGVTGGGVLDDEIAPAPYVQIMNYNLWEHPLETTQRICEGWWPKDVTDPSSKLLPSSDDELAEIGLFVYEGLSVMSDYIMGDKLGGLANRMSKGESLNSDNSFKLKDGDLTFGGNARTHYGFTQRRILDNVERTRALPGHVGFTAHERKSDDDDTRQSWIGPDVCGNMLTVKIGASFGNTIHLHPVRKVEKINDPVTKKTIETISLERRAYTRSHYDPEAQHFTRYYANTRLPIEIPLSFMPEFIPPDPIAYYRRLQEAREQAAVKLPDVVGLKL